jgi:hypothetical protein
MNFNNMNKMYLIINIYVRYKNNKLLPKLIVWHKKIKSVVSKNLCIKMEYDILMILVY